MDKATTRVVHVPLTDAEWRSLHLAAHDQQTTKGQLTADALRKQLLKGKGAA